MTRDSGAQDAMLLFDARRYWRITEEMRAGMRLAKMTRLISVYTDTLSARNYRCSPVTGDAQATIAAFSPMPQK